MEGRGTDRGGKIEGKEHEEVSNYKRTNTRRRKRKEQEYRK